ncbi:MAG: alpha/beta hydrolase [Myxococcota bacterium]
MQESVSDPLRQAFVDAQQVFLSRYGVNAASRFVDVPSIGGRAHALVTGEGPPVVMLSGLGNPGAMWAPLMAELNGFRLVAIDLPGFGLTDAKPEMARDPRKSAVRFFEDALGALGLDSPPIIANSLGSLWSMWLALDRPGRVAKLVHVGAPGSIPGLTPPLPFRLLSVRPLGRLQTRLQPPSPAGIAQLSKAVNEYPLVPELVDLLVATGRLPGGRLTMLDALHFLLRLRGARPEAMLTDADLARMAQPTLLVWGEQDPFAAVEAGEHMAATMPDAQLHVVPTGHAPWLTYSEHVGPVVGAFLRGESS